MNSSTLMRAAGNAASSAMINPLPSAVPRCVSSRSIAATRSSRLLVGDCTTAADAATATTPIRTLRGCASMKVFAASRAALRRFGLTSVARMLFDMSSARTIASSRAGNLSAACGRAIARISAVSASVHNSNGSMRRMRLALLAVWPPTVSRLAYCVDDLRRRQRAPSRVRPRSHAA